MKIFFPTSPGRGGGAVLGFVPTFDQVKSIGILLKIFARPVVDDETERGVSHQTDFYICIDSTVHVRDIYKLYLFKNRHITDLLHLSEGFDRNRKLLLMFRPIPHT